MARVHRIGQTRTCHVYRFCTVGTVEERVQQRAEKKLFLEQMVNRGSHVCAPPPPSPAPHALPCVRAEWGARLLPCIYKAEQHCCCASAGP